VKNKFADSFEKWYNGEVSIDKMISEESKKLPPDISVENPRTKRKIKTIRSLEKKELFNVRPFAAGEIYRDENVTVTAIATKHIGGGAFGVRVRGEELELRTMNGLELLITGHIQAVELL